MLELTDISKSYGPTRALEPTSLTVDRGRTVVLIGPSGCGKSTLLRVVSGLVRPDGGDVRWDGQSLLDAATLKVFRQRTGYVIQDGGLFPHLTARRNVTLLARHLGRADAESDRRIADLCELTRLSADVLDRYPAELSGGQRQRVALIRALQVDPEVLLLDEPMGALDPVVRFDLQEDLARAIRELRKTVLMVTHDMAEAAFFADELVVMNGGRVVQRGAPQAVIDRPADAFVERFVRAQRDPFAGAGEKR